MTVAGVGLPSLSAADLFMRTPMATAVNTHTAAQAWCAYAMFTHMLRKRHAPGHAQPAMRPAMARPSIC